MKHRISTGVLIFKDDKLLLIKHVDPTNKVEWWVPPGGGVQGEESVEEAARREVYEEAGLEVEIGQLAYVRQLILKEYNMITLYVWARSFRGESHIDNIVGEGADEDYIQEARWCTQEEVQDLPVLPSILKKEVWTDRHSLPPARLIGLDREF